MFQSSANETKPQTFSVPWVEYRRDAMSRLVEWRRYLAVASATLLVLFVLRTASNIDYSHASLDSYKMGPESKVWVTMSLCLSKNAEVYGKKDFPYVLATELATRIWLNKTEDINVVVQLVRVKVRV